MKLALKNVKIAGFASQETTCFEATLYIDDKRAAVVSNEGHGGPNHYQFNSRELESQFYAYAKSLPPLPDEGDGLGECPMDEDILIGKLLSDFEVQKQYRRWCKKSTVFRLKDDKKGEFRTYNRPFSPQVKATIVAKYGDQIELFINETL